MTTQPPRDALAVPDLRGIDAGPIEEWLDLRKRGQVPRDADYVLVSDLSKVVAQNLHLAAQPSAQEPAQSLPTAPKFANVDWVRDGIANFIADNWPDRKHSLAEIEAGVRAIEINPPKASLLPLPAEPVAPEHAQLMKFYAVNSMAALVDAQAKHIEKLQAKLPPLPSLAAPRLREG